jgi:hypothetical protein
MPSEVSVDSEILETFTEFYIIYFDFLIKSLKKYIKNYSFYGLLKKTISDEFYLAVDNRCQ